MHVRIRTLGFMAFAALTQPAASAAQELIVQVPEITVAAAVQLVDARAA